MAATVFGIGLLSIGSLVFAATWSYLPGAISLWFAASALLWVIFVRPRVVVARAGITVVNPLRTIVLPWSQIESLDNRYSLSITTAARRFSAWAAVAPTRFQSRRIESSDLRNTYLSGRTLIRAADSPLSETGGVLMLAEYWKRELGTQSDDAPIQVIISWPAIGLLAAAVLVIAIALSLGWL